jgi:hypothetical protein
LSKSQNAGLEPRFIRPFLAAEGEYAGNHQPRQALILLFLKSNDFKLFLMILQLLMAANCPERRFCSNHPYLYIAAKNLYQKTNLCHRLASL